MLGRAINKYLKKALSISHLYKCVPFLLLTLKGINIPLGSSKNKVRAHQNAKTSQKWLAVDRSELVQAKNFTNFYLGEIPTMNPHNTK